MIRSLIISSPVSIASVSTKTGNGGKRQSGSVQGLKKIHLPAYLKLTN